jgi:hypothetical protein
LGDLAYRGDEMFIMHYIGRHELMFGIHLDAIKEYNKMHVDFMKILIKILGFRVSNLKFKF